MNDMNKQIHYVLYHSDESDVAVNAVLQNDSIWVTQKAMADLFAVNTPAISKHLKNIFLEERCNFDYKYYTYNSINVSECIFCNV